MNKSVLPKLEKFAPAKQRRLDQLLEKNSEGTISAKEKAKLELLVAEADELMVTNSQRLAEFAQSQSPAPPVNAIPVTIWGNPQLAEQL